MSANPLGQMANTGAASVLNKAADTLLRRGWVKGVTRDIQSGRLDVLGAIAYAAGAKIKDIGDSHDLLTSAVPRANRAAALIAWEALMWVCEDDPLRWQDCHELDDVLRALRFAATRLEIAVR